MYIYICHISMLCHYFKFFMMGVQISVDLQNRCMWHSHLCCLSSWCRSQHACSDPQLHNLWGTQESQRIQRCINTKNLNAKTAAVLSHYTWYLCTLGSMSLEGWTAHLEDRWVVGRLCVSKSMSGPVREITQRQHHPIMKLCSCWNILTVNIWFHICEVSHQSVVVLPYTGR